MPKTIAGPLRQHVWLCLSLSCALSCFAQSNSGTVRGTVADPSGAVISGAVVSVDNPVSHYSRNTVTDNQGKFEFDNLPYNNYHLTVVAKGFQAAAEDINVRSSVPMEVKFGLTVGQEKQTVTVEAGEDLVESTPVTHTDVDRGLFEKLPLESQSSVAQFAGDAGRRPESRPIPTACFTARRSRFELLLGGRPADHRPAEQGLLQSDSARLGAVDGGDRRRAARRIWRQDQLGDCGDHALRARADAAAWRRHGFLRHVRHRQRGLRSGIRRQELGQLHFRKRMNTGRFLDGPEFTGHARSWQRGERVRPRRFQAFRGGAINLNLGLHAVLVPDAEFVRRPERRRPGRGWWWTTNGLGPNGLPVGPHGSAIEDQDIQHCADLDAGDRVRTRCSLSAASCGRINTTTIRATNPFADLQPDLQLQTIGQNRRLTNPGRAPTVSYVKGIHNIKAGVIYEDTIPDRKRRLRNCRSDGQCGLSERGWQPVHGRRR